MDLADMFDGINVARWPANTKYGLVYTDGQYANRAAAVARFPGIVLQTISAVGAVPAMWVDCEPGCVWPPDHAVQVYAQWRTRGCRGIYCAQATKPAVRAAAKAMGLAPEIFGADWTGVRHINPDEAQTQWSNTPGFDVSAIPAPVAPAPPPGPAPTIPQRKADDMRVIVATSDAPHPPQPVVTAGQHFLLFGTAYRYVIENPADLQALIGTFGPVVPLTGSFIANIPLMP